MSTTQSYSQPVNPLAYAVGEGGAETDRLNRQHAMLTDLFRGLTLSPIQNPKSILDVGTGPESWALQMAAAYPNAQVIGIDLREEPGIPRRLPPNYRYMQGDILKGLPLPDGSMDYVHMRALWTALRPEQWPVALKELVRVTRSDGWIESVEGGLPRITDGATALSTYTGWVRLLMLQQRGVDADYAARLPFDLLALSPSLVKAVTFFTQGIPYGKQYGPIGAANEQNLFDAAASLKDPIVAGSYSTGANFDSVLQAVHSELVTTQVMAPVYVLYAQRV